MDNVLKGNHKAGEIEIIQQNLIIQNAYLRIYNDEVVFPSGKEGTYFRVVAPNQFSVGVLPVMRDGKIALIRNFRHAARGWGYEIPKGEALANEDAETAALRELREETGLVPERLIYLGEYCESPAIFSSRIKCFVAVNCEKRDGVDLDETEAIANTELFTTESYFTREYAHDFCDAVTDLIVMRYSSDPIKGR